MCDSAKETRPVDGRAETGNESGGVLGAGLRSIRDEIERHNQNQVVRAGLRDRIIRQTEHAQQEANRASRLHRLIALMDKHPDLCEIIDLLQGLNLL